MGEYDDSGVVFVATGSQFLTESVQAAKSVRECCPDVSMTLFTSLDERPEIFDTVLEISNPAYGFGDKVENLGRSPYERTIYMDGDVYIHDERGIYDMFDMLERFDFVGVKAMMRTADIGPPHDRYSESIPDGFPVFNGGILGYRDTSAVDTMLETWASKYDRDTGLDEQAGDQPALRASLYESDLHIGRLPPEYNFRVPYEQMILDDPKILHGRASNIAEVAKTVSDADSLEKARIYVPVYAGRHGPSGKDMHVEAIMNPRMRELKARRIIKSVREHGVVATCLYLLLGGVNRGYTRVDKLRDEFHEKGFSGAARRAVQWALRCLSRP